MTRGDASAASTAARVTSTKVIRSTGTSFSARRACRSRVTMSMDALMLHPFGGELDVECFK